LGMLEVTRVEEFVRYPALRTNVTRFFELVET
jgi:hypothetical protein